MKVLFVELINKFINILVNQHAHRYHVITRQKSFFIKSTLATGNLITDIVGFILS